MGKALIPAIVGMWLTSGLHRVADFPTILCPTSWV